MSAEGSSKSEIDTLFKKVPITKRMRGSNEVIIVTECTWKTNDKTLTWWNNFL